MAFEELLFEKLINVDRRRRRTDVQRMPVYTISAFDSGELNMAPHLFSFLYEHICAFLILSLVLFHFILVLFHFILAYEYQLVWTTVKDL